MVAKLDLGCICVATSGRCLWDECAMVDGYLKSGETLCATSRCGICMQGGATRTFRSGAVQDVRRIASHGNQVLTVKVLDRSKLTYHLLLHRGSTFAFHVARGFLPCGIMTYAYEPGTRRAEPQTSQHNSKGSVHNICQITCYTYTRPNPSIPVPTSHPTGLGSAVVLASCVFLQISNQRQQSTNENKSNLIQKRYPSCRSIKLEQCVRQSVTWKLPSRPVQ
jgi:hypothetical protein